MNFREMDRRLITILLIVFVNVLGASMILPLLPLYAKRQFQMSDQVIPLLITSFFAAQFLAGPVMGRLSDRYGRIPVLILSQIGTVISFIMLAFAPNTGWLFAARILDGITGGNIIVAQAYITDITPPKKRTESLGYVYAAFGLGFIFGPALGGLLSALAGVRIPFILAALAATGVVLMTWRFLEETLPPERRGERATVASPRSGLAPGAVLRNRPLLTILLLAFAGQFSLGMLQATFALYGEDVLFRGFSDQVTNLGVGLLLGFFGVGQFFTQTWLLRRLLKRYSEPWLVLAGTLLRAGGSFAFALITSPWLAPPAAFGFAVGIGIMMPALQSLATRTVDDRSRGGVLGLYQSSVSLSTIASTGVSGLFYSMSPVLPYWIGGVVSLTVALPALALLRWFAKHPG